MADKPDSVTAIRVPYRHLKRDTEVEMIGFTADSPPQTRVSGDGGDVHRASTSENCGLLKLILSCTIAAGVQFGWALQLSLLTPYVQTLGIGHAFSSFIWLCGPITGLVVQPCVGIWSDKCTSKYGRRRPFILAGSLMISVAVIIIGFSADIGYLLGDTKEHCSTFKGTRTRAAFVFVVGFWMLDLANNTVQGPARALLADLSGPDQRNTANAVFASWMAVGNILGFSAGASGNWHTWFPFLINRACCEACGNLKAAFLVAVVFLSFCTLITLYVAKEIPLEVNIPRRLSDSAPLLEDPQRVSLDNSKSMTKDSGPCSSSENGRRVENDMGCEESTNDEHFDVDLNDGPGSVMVKLLTSLRHLPPGMHSVLIVTALTWLSWFPFLLFDTDWMGREVYHGNPIGNGSEVTLYDRGVRAGAVGLLLNSVVLGVGSFLIEPMCRLMGTRVVWALSNFIVFISMAGITIISLVARKNSEDSSSTKTAALVVFAVLGFPLSITYSVPYSVTAEVTADSGGGQGLALGVLNLAVVVPQMIISLGAGPWDALFGGGNIPAFVLASLAAFAAGVIATLKLPNISGSFKSAGMHIG